MVNEKYQINIAAIPSIDQKINLGRYYTKVKQKQIAAYGEDGAYNINQNVIRTYAEIQTQLANPHNNRNILLVGRVQSGKTSNLELFSAIAFDNGYNVLVIYGGYDSNLLRQTTNRFIETFDIPINAHYDDDKPAIFSTDDSNTIPNIDDSIIEELLLRNKPIIFVSMKRPVAMRKINELFSRINKDKFKAFVIDDEGDQASLNTSKNKITNKSATYCAITDLKAILGDPLYLSVTATPQANIFLDEYSKLRPATIRLIQPGNGYCGTEEYHLFDANTSIEIVRDDDHSALDDNRLPVSIRRAINYYIVASAIMLHRNIEYSDMIIHSYREVGQHTTIYNIVTAYIDECKNLFCDDGVSPSFECRVKELEDIFDSSINSMAKNGLTFLDVLPKIKQVIRGIYPILKNSRGGVTQTNESLRFHKIYIGGDLLQRGLTFKHLVTTYFTRWAQNGGNMDTNLQRARWFGYRTKYIDLCKVFTTENIAEEFSTLAEIENDLWEQFYAIEHNELDINELIISAESTNQKPTRKNVVDYKRISFRNRWIKQRYGIFDALQTQRNNKILEQFISKLELIDTTVGRTDDGISARYTIINGEEMLEIMKHIQTVFEREPFELRALKSVLSNDSATLVLMPSCYRSPRERSFYSDNKIKALHQGADKKDKTKLTYQGDSFVIVNPDKINIQIHKIVPQKNSTPLLNLVQYMFAIYIPRDKIYFVRGK